MNFNSRKLMYFIMISSLLLTSIFAATSSVINAEAKAKVDAQTFHDAMRKLWDGPYHVDAACDCQPSQ